MSCLHVAHGRERSPRSDASFVRVQSNPSSPRRWSIHQTNADICPKPSVTGAVCRGRRGARINGCPVNCIIDLLMDSLLKGHCRLGCV